eukprot:482758-Pleurochrysis_carterae.AAC.1
MPSHPLSPSGWSLTAIPSCSHNPSPRTLDFTASALVRSFVCPRYLPRLPRCIFCTHATYPIFSAHAKIPQPPSAYISRTLSIVCEDEAEAARVSSQLKLIIRPMYSSPPIHGAMLVAEARAHANALTYISLTFLTIA